MASLQQLRQKIHSAEVTGKITRAMRTVASAKLRKFRLERDQISAFYNEYYAIIGMILASVKKQPKNARALTGPTLYVVTGSAMGLCGPHNTNMNRLLLEHLQPQDKIYILGKKAAPFWKSRGLEDKIMAIRGVTDANISFELSLALGAEILHYYTTKKFTRICCVYAQTINALTQVPRIMQLLPLDHEFIKQHAPDPVDLPTAPIDFEPDADLVVAGLTPQFLQVALYGCLIESKVAEYASRQATMNGATHNADKLRDEYLLGFNQIRQAKITQEITEIIQAAPEGE